MRKSCVRLAFYPTRTRINSYGNDGGFVCSTSVDWWITFALVSYQVLRGRGFSRPAALDKRRALAPRSKRFQDGSHYRIGRLRERTRERAGARSSAELAPTRDDRHRRRNWHRIVSRKLARRP